MANYRRGRLGQIIRTRDEMTIPENDENIDYQEFLTWVSRGNSLADNQPTQAIPVQRSPYNWNNLAIALKLSKFNELLNNLKDANDNPQINTIWRLSDDISQIITISVSLENTQYLAQTDYPNDIYVLALERDLVKLFETLKLGEIKITLKVRKEVVSVLKTSGFETIANRLMETA